MTKVVPTQAKATKVNQPAVEAVLPPVAVIEGVIDTAVGNGELLPPIELAAEVFTHSIKASPANGFYRAGKLWTREEVSINRADFTDEQWAAIEAEPMLTIQQL